MQRAERWNSIEERQNLLLSRTHRCDVLLHIVLTAGAFSSHCFILFSEEANIGLLTSMQSILATALSIEGQVVLAFQKVLSI